MTSQAQTIESFRNNYLTLSKNQKKIWNYLHWFCKRKRVVKPSHDHIAKKIGCCRRTVIRAVEKFVEWGWLGTIHKAYSTCQYFMCEGLLKINPSDRNTFDRKPIEYERLRQQNVTEDVTEDVTHNDLMFKHKRYVSVQSAIPQFLNDLPLKTKDKLILTKYNDRTLLLAIEDARTYNKRIYNLPAFLTSRCKAYLRKAA